MWTGNETDLDAGCVKDSNVPRGRQVGQKQQAQKCEKAGQVIAWDQRISGVPCGFQRGSRVLVWEPLMQIIFACLSSYLSLDLYIAF